MKKDDYKRALDGIHCSEEFKEKMEKKLAGDEHLIPEGFEDSVSSVEIAPKRNWLKFIAAAAAVVLVIGGSGAGAYHYFQNMEDAPDDIAETTEPSEAAKKTYSTPFGKITGMSLQLMGTEETNDVTIEELPDKMITDIVELMNNEELTSPLEKPSGLEDTGEDSEAISLHCDGEQPFTYYLSSSGFFSFSNDKDSYSTYYVTPDLYFAMYGFIAKDMVYADLSEQDVEFSIDGADETTLLSKNKKKYIHEIFDRYSDETEVAYTSYGSPLLNGTYLLSKSEIELTNEDESFLSDYAYMIIDERFLVDFSDSANYTVTYMNGGGIGYSWVIDAPDALLHDVYDILRMEDVEEETTEETSKTYVSKYTPEAFGESVYQQIHAMNDDVEVRFHPSENGKGRHIDFCLAGDARERILALVENMEWEKADDYEPVVPFYNAYHLERQIQFGIDGVVYDPMSGMVCRTKDMGAYSQIIDAFEESVRADNYAYAMYLLTVPEKNYTTLEGDYESFFEYENDKIDKPALNGKGHVFVSKPYEAESIILDDFGADSYFKGCTLEYVRRGDKNAWVLSGTRNEATGGKNSFFDIEAISDTAVFDLISYDVHSKTSSLTVVGDVYRFDFDICYDGTHGRRYKLDVDSRGTPLLYETTSYGYDDGVRVTRRFCISNVVYDSDDFELPELSAEAEANMKRSSYDSVELPEDSIE